MAFSVSKNENDRARAYALLKKGELTKARELLVLICKNNSADTESWFYLGALNGQMGAHGDAAKCFQNVIAQAPGSHQAHYNLGIALRGQGMLEKAAEAFSAAAALSPDSVNIFSELGFVLIECKRFRDAVTALKQVVRLSPQDPASYSSHADVCLLAGDLFAAIESLQRLAELKPKVSSVYTRLGDAYFRLGELDAAIESYRKAVRLKPIDPVCGSRLLSALNFSTKYPLPKLFTEARRWGMLHLRRATVAAGGGSFSRADHKIRIGYMTGSSDMLNLSPHIRPLLLQFDSSRFDVFCYGDTLMSGVNSQIGGCNTKGMDPFAIVDTLMADKIDILVDLSGHGKGSALEVFAVQPAPLQVSYLGYPYTTGLPSVQYRITDVVVDPESDAPPLYTEELLCLERCGFYYCPENKTILPRTTKRVDSGNVIRLGVVAELSALNETFMTALRGILENSRDVELHIFDTEISDRRVRKSVESRLAGFGIPEEAIRWGAPGNTEDTQLAIYNQFDVLLDTMPMCGLTAICQALWMGVPVVTLAGDRPSSRIGKSVLESIGLPELVLSSVDAYVAKVLALLENRAELRALQESLHQKMIGSPLCDSSGFVQSIEAVYMKIYQDAS